MTTTRRRPTQARGKERYDRIVDATKSLIGARGNDDVSIRDIAREADIAPSTIYQYFDDKNDIIVAIMEAYFDRSYEALADKTGAAETLEDWIEAVEASFEFFFEMIQQDPGWATIWSGIQASPALRDFDNEDALRNARLLQQQLLSFCPNVPEREALSACILLVQMAAVTARMALFTDPEIGDDLIAEFKRLSRLRILSMTEDQ